MCWKSELGKAVGKNRINRLNDNNSLLKVFTEAALQEVFLRKGVLKYVANLQENTMPKCEFKGRLQRNFIEIALRHGCPPVNLLYIFRTPFQKSTFTWDPKWTQTVLKSQTALKCRSVYMAIYMETSLRQLSRQQQDSIAPVKMISFNQCKLNCAKKCYQW